MSGHAKTPLDISVEVNLETTEAALNVLRIARDRLRDGDLQKIGTYYAEAVDQVVRPLVRELVELRAAIAAARGETT